MSDIDFSNLDKLRNLLDEREREIKAERNAKIRADSALSEEAADALIGILDKIEDDVRRDLIDTLIWGKPLRHEVSPSTSYPPP